MGKFAATDMTPAMTFDETWHLKGCIYTQQQSTRLPLLLAIVFAKFTAEKSVTISAPSLSKSRNEQY